MRRFLLPFLALGLIAGCAPSQDLGSRLAAANLLAGSLATGLERAATQGVVTPGSDTAAAMLATMAAIEVALDGAGNAWRANLPQLAVANLAAAERQMAGLRPLLPAVAGNGGN